MKPKTQQARDEAIPLAREDADASLFRTWFASDVEARRDSSRAAREYVAGTWYVRFSEFHFKDQGKALGAKWHDPAKRWYAPSAEVLLALCTEGGDQELLGVRLASPMGLDGASTRGLLRTISCFLNQQKEAEALAEAERVDASRAEVARRGAREQEARDRELARLVPPDEPETVALLKNEYGLTLDDELRSLVNSDNELGPRLGISVAARLARGIRLELRSLEDLKAGRVPLRSLPRRTASRKRSPLTVDAGAGPLAPQRELSAAPGIPPPPGEASRAPAPTPLVSAAPAASTSSQWPFGSPCGECGEMVWVQFLECLCAKRTWQFCGQCGEVWCTQQLGKHGVCARL
jgi:hypothetical protein